MSSSSSQLLHRCEPSCAEWKNMLKPVVFECGHSMSEVCTRSFWGLQENGKIQKPVCLICARPIESWAYNFVLREFIDRPKVDSENPQPSECSICLNELKDRVTILGCGHSFTPDCLEKYLQSTHSIPTCPNCKNPIRWQARNYTLEAAASNTPIQGVNEATSGPWEQLRSVLTNVKNALAESLRTAENEPRVYGGFPESEFFFNLYF